MLIFFYRMELPCGLEMVTSHAALYVMLAQYLLNITGSASFVAYCSFAA
jgi:hypothetical protein